MAMVRNARNVQNLLDVHVSHLRMPIVDPEVLQSGFGVNIFIWASFSSLKDYENYPQNCHFINYVVSEYN